MHAIRAPGVTMTPLPSASARRGRLLKNLALCFAMSGFALELGGGITGHWLVFKIGLFLFLLAFPLFLFGLFLGRR
jgi:hypothetical protein